MAEQPLISCIVPVFNGECYLREALESIFAQTYRPIEVLLVDDGSTDSTGAVAASYGSRLRYLWQPNAGPAAARNRGLDAARGEFVAFLDADDLWHPEKLARQMARFAARPGLDGSVAHVQMRWEAEVAREGERCRGQWRAGPVPGYSTTTLLARRDLFDRVGRFDERRWFGDAVEWFMRASERGAVVELLPDVLLWRRLHEGNLSRLRAADGKDEFLGLVKAILERRRAAGGVDTGAGGAPAGPPGRSL
jgi:glycosyltransferase involved in cell wall biosynthesis